MANLDFPDAKIGDNITKYYYDGCTGGKDGDMISGTIVKLHEHVIQINITETNMGTSFARPFGIFSHEGKFVIASDNEVELI